MKKLYVAFIICVFVSTITPQTQSNHKPSLVAASAHLQANLSSAGGAAAQFDTVRISGSVADATVTN